MGSLGSLGSFGSQLLGILRIHVTIRHVQHSFCYDFRQDGNNAWLIRCKTRSIATSQEGSSHRETNLYSRNLGINFPSGPLQIIRRWVLGQLSLLRPLPDGFIILALMLSIEVNKWHWFLLIPPNLSKHTRINGAHELLSENIKTVRFDQSAYLDILEFRTKLLTNVPFYDIFFILESPFTQTFVVVVVILQAFAQKVKAMKMVQAFDVGWIASSIFVVDLDMIL